MEERRITKIPFPGNSGDTPTGAMQFLDDGLGCSSVATMR